MGYPKWKYTNEGGAFRSTLVGNADAEEQLGAAWVDDPVSLGVDVAPAGGPADASGRVAFGPPAIVAGVNKASIGG